MIAKILMTVSAAIILTFGALHLLYTFRGPKLTPRDPALQTNMTQVSPVISNEMTMWQGWIGFNATHSSALILFGLIFGFLALRHEDLLFASPFLLIVGFVMLAGLVIISKAYFFSTPFAGVTVALLSYIASIIASRFS
jgi:hypothetical protein